MLTCVMDTEVAVQAWATSTYLGLPLSPEASSPSEGGDAALGTDPGSGDDGDVLGFGKHLSEISHVCQGRETGKQGAVQALTLSHFHTHLP